MSHVIGIDLGTTNSCVAYMDGEKPVVIPNNEGTRTTASIVAFTQSGERLVGQIAKRQAITNPENTIHAVKRLMGRKMEDEEVQRVLDTCAYRIVPADNGDAWVDVRGRKYSPPEISSLVLKQMRKIAEDYLGCEVTEAVVTVPAYFDDSQRQATKAAGEIAGLNVRRIINEPTAASLAYGLDKKGIKERIVVYDLGGGTFDVSILELTEGTFQVKATAGDTHLGGEDFDQAVIRYLADTFHKESGIDLLKDRMALQRLKEAAEKAKCELSVAVETEVNLPFITADSSGPKHLIQTIKRDELERLTLELVEKTLVPCKKALKDSGLTKEEIDEVILVGGQTRMPLVQRRVEDFFGKKAHKGVNPDEVVAVGAAIQGSVLEGQIDDVLLLDVTPLSLGVETAGGVFTRMIHRNTPIPTRKSEVFSTAVDNQPLVNVHVLQGERELSQDNKSLAHFQLLGIPPAPRGVPQIEVSFAIDANGIVDVAAKDLATGKSQSVRVVPTSGLTHEEIERIQREAEEHGEEDRKRRDLVDAKNSAETLIYTTQKAVDEYGDLLALEERGEIEEDLKYCKARVDDSSSSLQQIKEAIERLEGSAHRIYEVMYREAAAMSNDIEDTTLPNK